MGKETFNPEWVQKARENDAESLEKLYVFCYQPVYLTIKYLMQNNEDTVMDILQDTFIEAFKKLDQLGDDSKFPAWVKTIARNRTMDLLRRNKIYRMDSIDVADEDDDKPEMQLEDMNADASPELQMDQQETARLIREILNSLSAGQRAAITMYYYEDMSIAEIARFCGISEGTVKAQLHSGRKKIEQKVLALEKQGTKLYSVLPFPFFALLLRNMDSISMGADTAALGSILQQCGIQSTATTTAGAVQTVTQTTQTAGAQATTQASALHTATAQAAKTAGAAAGSSIKWKIVAGIAAVSIIGIGGGVAGLNHINQKSLTPETQYEETAESNREPQEKTQKSADVELEADIDTEYSAEAQQYSTLLKNLQDDGTYLQYAHMEDINGDGTEELIVLHDNTDLTVYQIQQDEPKAVYETSNEDGFMCYEELIHNQTYEEACGEYEQPGVTVDFKTSEHKMKITLLPENGMQENYTVLVVDCDTWEETKYECVYDEASVEEKITKNGNSITYQEFLSETEEEYRDISAASDDSSDLMFSDQLGYLLGKSDMKTAYEQFIQQEKGWHDSDACYEYIYLDDDDIPELIVTEGSAFSSQVTLYCYKEGLVKQVQTGLGSNGEVYYKERKNQLLSKVSKDTGEAALYSLQNGELVTEHTSTFYINSNGDTIYEIDGQFVSPEEGENFWNLDGEEIVAGEGSENAIHFQDNEY